MTRTFKSMILAACTVAALGTSLNIGAGLVLEPAAQARGNGGGGGGGGGNGGDGGGNGGGGGGGFSPNYDSLYIAAPPPTTPPRPQPPRIVRAQEETYCNDARALPGSRMIRCQIVR